jgi:hypothetical protein
MPRAKRLVEAGLLAKGFKQANTHHRYFVYYTLAGAKTAVRTRTSQGHGEIDEYLLSQMSKQCKVTKPDFLQLVDCPLTQVMYEALLQQNGHL